MVGKGDAGYFNTARILVEQGLCLAEQRRNPKMRDIKGGFFTPAAGVGTAVLERWGSVPSLTLEVDEMK